MKIESPAFANNESIPSKYTCDGSNINPPLRFYDIPKGTQSLVLIVDDPDAPKAPAGGWVHWLVWNIDPKVGLIEEDDVPEGAVEGKTSFGRTGYGGPCPPDREHRYFFRLYALDTVLNLPAGSDREALEAAMENHIISESELMGRYERI